MNFLVFQMLKEPKYLGLSFLLSVLLFFLYPISQVAGQGLNNYWFWFSLLTPFRWFLYLSYVILFGITLSFFFWQRKKKICPVSRSWGGGFLGFLSGFFATSTTLCPACLPWVALFLPFSSVLILAKYSTEIMIFSIAILFLSLWLLGGFKRLK